MYNIVHNFMYTGMVSKIEILPRRRPEFDPSEAVDEAAQL